MVPAEGADRPRMIGGTWWSIARLLLSVLVLSAIPFALLGYATLAAHLHNAIFSTSLMIAVVGLTHRLVGDLLEEAAAPDTPPGRWVRHRLGLAPNSTLRGQHLVMLVVDMFLVLLLAVGIPAAWSVDTDAIVDGAGQLMRGVQGRRRHHLAGQCRHGDRGLRGLYRDGPPGAQHRARPRAADRRRAAAAAPVDRRRPRTISACLLALLIGIAVLGIDFTNLAIVLGALSVGIGLGLQNIANNVISGVILLVERPIKAGDWVNVAGHEGFVRRINIRATEMETFQRTHVIMPNSMFLQNPVVNRTYADTSSRVEIKLTVGLAHRRRGDGRPAARGGARPSARAARAAADRALRAASRRAGLDFELYVFVNRLEDRLVVTNDLNKAILARLIEAQDRRSQAGSDFKLQGLETPLGAARPPVLDGAAGKRRPMPPRRRRDEAPRRRWPFYLLFAAGVLAGVALWAYSPSLPPEMLVARYANDRRSSSMSAACAPMCATRAIPTASRWC